MAIVDDEKRVTLLDLYNDVTGQAWSMFDSEVEDQDEFEQNVLTSIRKSLSDLWNSFDYPFKERTHIISTKNGRADYELPAGNIIKIIKDKKTIYAVFCDSEVLSYNPECRYMPSATGKPESFYIKNDRIYLYPTPNDRYIVTLDYLLLYPACNEDGEEKATLENEDDYINVPEKYQELFMCALMPLTMWNYLIASESDENSSAYEIQYKRAYKRLIENIKGIDIDKRIGWRNI